jgi:hypothetical protein
MPHVTIAVIRHSISCANMYHNRSYRNDACDPLGAAIEKIPNPKLSKHGRIMCREYGPVLKERLEATGIDFGTALIGGSYLQRATETATRLFPGHDIKQVPYLTESGNVPVNQPDGGFTSSWPDALKYLARTGKTQFVIVSHGNYMRGLIWPSVSKEPSAYMGNLDTIVIRAVLTPLGHLLQPTAHRIDYDGRITTQTPGDTCSLPRSLAYIHKLARKTKKQQLAEQARGRQKGGWAPSIMGPFVDNGLRLIPLCGYLGYKMFRGRKTRRR